MGVEHSLASLDEEGARETPARRPARGLPRGLVEFVRLILVALGAAGGWEVSASLDGRGSPRLVLGIVLGVAIGYVAGGVFGRTTAHAVSDLEHELARMPASDLLGGGVGMFLGVGLATLTSLPLFHLPGAAAYATVAFTYASLGYAGARIGAAKSDEILALFGVKPVVALNRTDGDVSVIDSSALLDGRIASLVRLGFLRGTLLLTEGVLHELQAVADSSSATKRSRGRRALDVVAALKREGRVEIVLVADDMAGAEDVDSRLVRLARERGAALITNDAALASVAGAVDVSVRSLHALADAMRPSLAAGDDVSVRLLRPGRESGQAVGYLEDGTMVVVEGAADRVGATARITITNCIQTATGQMAFGRLAAIDVGAAAAAS
jgi:uncharacterized protein YacL